MLKTFKTTLKWIAAIVVICAVAVFLASINGLSVSRTIATVGENKITEAEYKYYLEVVKSQMLTENGAGEEFWDTEIDGKKASEVAKERAMDEAIRAEIAVVKAAEAGITLSEEELTAARSILNADDAATKEQIKELEKTTGADKYQLADIMEKAYLSNAYYGSLQQQENTPIAVSDEEISAKMTESYAAVKHVLIKNSPSTEEGETAAEVDAEKYAKDAKAKAEEVLAKAIGGANFESLIAEYGEDPGMESNPDGYVIDENGASADGSGSMVPEFTKGSFAVEAGNVNPELVESSYGWHIIKRYPITEENAQYSVVESSAKSAVMADKYNSYLDSFKDGLKVTINEKVYNKVKVK